MSDNNLDKNNIMIVEIGPNEARLALQQQIGYFRESERREPNCCILGISIVTILDSAGMFNNQEGQNYFENLKVYLDGDNPAAINVGYNPFINKQKIIL